MSTYYKISCPDCNYTLKNWEKRSMPGKIGAPIIRCPNCTTLIKTGKILLRDMSVFQKFVVVLELIYPSVVVSIGVTIVLVIVVQLITGIDIDEYGSELIYTWILLFIIFFGKQLFNVKINSKILSDDFDSQKFDRQDFL